MPGRHEALRQQVMAVCEPLVTQVTAQSEPFTQLSEHLDQLAEQDPTLLDELPTWIEGLTPGTQAAAVLGAFHGYALFRLSGPWLSHTVPTTAQLEMGPFFSNADAAKKVANWGKVCPPEVLRWWVMPPDAPFENEHAERSVNLFAISRTRNLYREMKDGHPWLTADRLWHDPDWRRVMLDGIRPSPTGVDPETQLMGRILGDGLSQWSAAELAEVKNDPCFPLWKTRWLASAPTQAAWRLHEAQEPETPTDRARRRLRT